MGTEYVNGALNPVIKIINGYTLIASISLDLTNEAGLIESNQDLKIAHELDDYTLLQDVRGVRIVFRLAYDQFSFKNNTKNIYRIWKYHKEMSENPNWKMILIPRSDMPNRKFSVLWTGENLDIGIMKGGVKAKGNRLINVEFTTREKQDDMNWIDPNDIIISAHLNNQAIFGVTV